MGHERSKALHNFNLPCGLKWGHQKFLRCAKVHHHRSIGRPTDLHVPRPSNGVVFTGSAAVADGGIAAVREKLMLDLQVEADKMKSTYLREASPPPSPANTAAAEAADGSRPWNLRTRRAACKAPQQPTMNGVPAAAGGLKVDGLSPPSKAESKSPRLGSEFVGPGYSTREEFSVSINRREIEEDFMEMVGHRPPRRPKKRAKFVQKNLDTLFPGLWLTEITPDLYKVPDDQ